MSNPNLGPVYVEPLYIENGLLCAYIMKVVQGNDPLTTPAEIYRFDADDFHSERSTIRKIGTEYAGILKSYPFDDAPSAEVTGSAKYAVTFGNWAIALALKGEQELAMTYSTAAVLVQKNDLGLVYSNRGLLPPSRYTNAEGSRSNYHDMLVSPDTEPEQRERIIEVFNDREQLGILETSGYSDQLRVFAAKCSRARKPQRYAERHLIGQKISWSWRYISGKIFTLLPVDYSS